MSKTSPNPRRYSRGKESLDAREPLHVYIELALNPSDLEITIRRVEHLLTQFPAVVVNVASYTREKGRIVIVLDINMGPAKEALLGTSAEVQAGYGFLWAATKTLYYAHPKFCSPPPTHDRLSPATSTHELLTLLTR